MVLALEDAFDAAARHLEPFLDQIAQLAFHVGIWPQLDESKLSFAANSFLIGAVPIIWYRNKHASNIVRPGSLLVLKMAAGLILTSTLLLDVYLRKPGTADWTYLSFPTLVSSLFASLFVTWIQQATHKQKLASSALLALWLVVSIFCDVVHAKFTFTHLGHQSMEFRVTSAAAGLKAFMLLCDEMPKHSLIKDDELLQNTDRGATAGFWSRCFFLWFGKTLVFGFRDHDVKGDILEAERRSASLLAQFKLEWQSVGPKSRLALLRVCLRMASWQFYLGCAARLAYVTFVSMQAFFIKSFVLYLTDTHKVDHDRRIASNMLAFGGIIYSGILISKATYMKLDSDVTTILRGIIVSAIHDKSLSLASTNANREMAQSLLDDTVDEIVQGFELFQMFWANMVTISLNVGILLSFLGPIAFGILLQTTFCILSARFVRKRSQTAQAEWSHCTKARSTQVSGMLSQIKSIKMIGLNTVVADQIRKLQRKETSKLIALRKWSTSHYAKASIQATGTPAVLLLCGLWWSNWTATPANAFATYLTVTLIEHPAGYAVTLWGLLASAKASIERVQNFLLLESMHKQRNKQLLRLEGVANNNRPQAPLAENVVFELRDAAVAALGGNDPVLRRVNMTVKRGEITMIAGPTSSGKSTILRAAVGEAKVLSGRRYKLHLSTAYCGQRVWLRSESIRDNILNGDQMDARWYSEVLDACQLRQDLRSMEKSDQTMVSSNGSNLSGGQKHRIALARALYHKPSLLVLDNVFSSLDRQTAGIIFLRLFGPRGLVRQLHITVIMSAHTPQCLKFADKFIFINAAKYVFQRNVEAADVPQQIRAVFGNVQLHPNNDTTNTRITNNVNGLEVRDDMLAETGKQRERDDLQRNSSWKALLFYFQPFTRIQFIGVVASLALLSMAEMSPGVYILLWLEKALPSSISFLSGYSLFCISNVALTTWSIGIILLQINPASTTKLHELLLQNTLGATLQYLTKAEYASVMSLFAHDMTSVSNELAMSFLKTIYALGNVLTTVGIIVYSIPRFFPLALLLLSALHLIQRQYTRTMRTLRTAELQSQAAMQTRFVETANGLEHVRAFGWRQHELGEMLKCVDSCQVASYAMKMNMRWLILHLDLICFTAGIFIVVAALTSSISMTGTRAGLALTTVFSLSNNLDFFVDSVAGLVLGLGSAERIQDFTENTPQEKTPKRRTALPKDWPENGKVVLKKVNARYSSSTQMPVLKDVSFTIMPGQRVGIVGRTGSGKTSLLMALLNFLEYTGTITIDGIDISKVDPEVLRASVTTVSQDSIEFDNTVRFNLCPWTMNATTTEEGNVNEVGVIELLEELGLWQLVRQFGGLDAKLSDLGLSQGQKQLICVIRACLHKLSSGSRLVIMDESTSELDADMVETVKDAMNVAFWDCTVITVAHRPEALDDVDMIMHMDEGRIVRKELPKQGMPVQATPQPAALPSGPVPMTPFFEELLQKSLRSEAEIAARLKSSGDGMR